MSLVENTGVKSVRADAHRNRERLLEAARAAFAAAGERVTLETIARDAGVGIGTLYRHFPTREALVEAVYRDSLDQLCDQAGLLLASNTPADALRTWMDSFARYISTKRDMADALRALISSGAVSSSLSRQRLTPAVQHILDAGAADGSLRDTVTGEDVVVSLVGIFAASSRPEQAERLMDLLMNGIRIP